MDIIVLGTGCTKCKDVYDRVKKVVGESNIAANVKKEEDIMEIMKYNVLSTPAVVIDGNVVAQGKVPTEKEILDILLTNGQQDVKPIGKEQIALSKFDEGYNCAQSVLYAFADDINIDKDILLSLSLSFGGGIGRKQEVCGAISGAVMALGAKYGKENNKNKDLTYSNVREFIDEFVKEKGSINCSDLLSGCNLLTEEGQSEFKKNNLGLRCKDYIALSCNLLQKHFSTSESDRIKALVKQQYGELALNSDLLKSGCCCGTNPASPSKKVFTIMSEDYSHLKGYEADADLGVGCGLPTQYAGLKEGNTVVDLGSGAGNDCFIARAEVGESGKVIGIDFSPQMIEKARKNAAKRGYANVEFIEGDIEEMPLPDNTADVVVSNCVLNLLPEKNRIFKEVNRVLKKGGHFCISDVVLNGVFPKEFTDNASMYAGCIASAIQREDYLGEIEKANFADIKVERTKTVVIPDEVLNEHLDAETVEKYKKGNVGIYSITVTGKKR